MISPDLLRKRILLPIDPSRKAGQQPACEPDSPHLAWAALQPASSRIFAPVNTSQDSQSKTLRVAIFGPQLLHT